MQVEHIGRVSKVPSLSPAGERYHKVFVQFSDSLKAGRTIDGRVCSNFAFDVIKLDGISRRILTHEIWTYEFLDLIINRIERKEACWTCLLSSIGNATATPFPQVVTRFVSNGRFIELISNFFTGIDTDAQVGAEVGCTAQKCASWIIANIFQTEEGKVPTAFLPLVPHFVLLMKSGSAMSTQSFRCLSAIFSVEQYRKDYADEYSVFSDLVLQGNFVESLFMEYSCGLRRDRVPGTSFFPDAYDRALTCQYLITNKSFQAFLVQSKVVPLLTSSICISYAGSDEETLLLWSRAVKSLHILTRTAQYHSFLLDDSLIINLASVAAGRYSADSTEKTASLQLPQVRLPLTTRKLAADMALGLGMKWEILRLFWIAQKKPQPKDCYLARLPVETIREILKWFVLLGGLSDAVASMIANVESVKLKLY
jgi:hypothetical protein